MDFKVLCWRPTCKNKFRGKDKVPGSRDYVCPRCGAGSRLVLFTRSQMEKGVKFEHLGSGEIVDTRYQRRRVDFRFKKLWVHDDQYFVVEMQKAGEMKNA